jgi:hypothetical protein
MSQTGTVQDLGRCLTSTIAVGCRVFCEGFTVSR